MRITLNWAVLVFLTAAAACSGDVVALKVTSTGTNADSAGHDLSYTMTSNTIKETPATGAAIVVTKPPTQAPGWPSVPGAKWIGPDADESNARNGCCSGIVKYVTTFDMKDPATGKDLEPDTARLMLVYAADDVVDVLLNGKKVLTH